MEATKENPVDQHKARARPGRGTLRHSIKVKLEPDVRLLGQQLQSMALRTGTAAAGSLSLWWSQHSSV